MDPAIDGLLTQLLAIDQTVPGIVNGLSDVQFNWQPGRNRWSIGQCLEHLNLTTERYIPVVRQAEAEARSRGQLRPGPFALGFLEHWFLRGMEPPARFRSRTRAAFIPAAQLDAGQTVGRFRTLNAELGACMRAADGIDLEAVKVKSQFGPVSWTMYGTFLVLLAHERRHLWQAQAVRNDPGLPRP